MIDRLNGSPFTSVKGDLKISRKNAVKSVNVLLNEDMRKAPITTVVKQVKANNATFTQGNFCCGASSNSISAEELNVLSMKLFLFSVGPCMSAAQPLEAARYRACASRGQPVSVHRFFLSLRAIALAAPRAAFLIGQWPVPPRLERLQVFARLKAYRFPRRDVHFGAGAGISADASLPRLHGKHAETAQLDPVVGLQGILHAIEDGVHSLFGFCLADSRPLVNLIHKIVFDHWNLPVLVKPTTTICCTYF